jgi:MazG family protein
MPRARTRTSRSQLVSTAGKTGVAPTGLTKRQQPRTDHRRAGTKKAPRRRSPDAKAAARQFVRLVEIMATLRGRNGCPWDREQTIDSLKPFVLEETYEVLEAIDRQDHDGLREELGDFLFEAVFLAQLESEAGHFEISDAIKTVADKLIRRHPHVFGRSEGAGPLDSADQVRVQWEEIKTQERGGEGMTKTLLSGIPQGLPALLRAYQIGSRAASVGFDWPRADDVMAKIQEEVDEIREVVCGARSARQVTPLADTGIDAARQEEEIGDLLFAIANLSRKLGVEPETALRRASDKFTRRFTTMEARIVESGRRLRDLDLAALEREWQKTKG